MEIFGKKVKNNDSQIYFKFTGTIEKRNYDVYKIINQLFDEESVDKYCNDSIKFIKDIRKVLIDFEEIELIVKADKNNEEIYSIKIENKKVVEYKTTNKEKFIFDFSNNKINGNLNYDLEEAKKILNMMQEEIKKIESINKMKLTKDIYSRKEKTIIEMYKLFYDDDIDFSSKTVYNELCIMLLILNRYEIATSEIEYEIIDNKIRSFEIADLVERFKYYGKVTNNSIEIRDYVIKVINLIKSEIKTPIKEKNYDELNKIAICSYFTDCYTYKEVDDIMKHNRIRDCYNKEEISKVYKLLKKMDEKEKNCEIYCRRR